MLPKLATIWDLPADITVAPLKRGGYNNTLFGVTLPGQSVPAYVLRMYGNHASRHNIEHELAILLQLQRQKLPFAVPAPEITRRGELCATVQAGDVMKLMVLLPFVAGANPDIANLAQARAVGVAVAQLDKALTKVDVRGLRLPPGCAELGRVHPLVPEPLEAVAQLRPLIARDSATRLQSIIERVLAADIGGKHGLKPQLTHGDIIPGNMLMQDERVCALLDFENCAINPRIADLASALDVWLWDVIGQAALWRRLDALGRGFCSVSAPSDEERRALPDLILLRNASVLMHLIGRFTGGLSPYVDVESWVETMCGIDDWLIAEGGQLVEHALAWR